MPENNEPPTQEPMIMVSAASLKRALAPIETELKKTIIDIMPVIPNRDFFKDFGNNIIDGIKGTVENKTIENTVVQEVAIPPQLIKLLQMQTEAISLLKKQQPEAKTSLDDYKPHDQTKKNQAGISYFGFEDITGKWYILCQQGRQQRYAAGDSDYIGAWKQREQHRYKTLSEAMHG